MIEYQEQTWADGEAGGTPINASRLGHMEDGIKAACDECDSDKWQSGDTMSVAGLYMGGYITASGTALRFSIPLNRQIADGVSVSAANNWTMNVRSEGGYEIGSSSTAGTVSASNISLTKRPGWIAVSVTASGLSNNVSVGIAVNSGTVAFT